MEWIITLLYIMGALVMHYIIYSSKEAIEHESANIACLLWLVALCIVLLLYIERLIVKIKLWICK